jgi:hypothetical protein
LLPGVARETLNKTKETEFSLKKRRTAELRLERLNALRCRYGLCKGWPRKEIPLKQFDSFGEQEFQFALGLNAFSDDPEFEHATSLDDPSDDCLSRSVLVDIPNESHIDFDVIRLKISE